MVNRTTVLTAAAFAFFLWTAPARSQSGYELFQKALVKERAEGNLSEAIQLYRRVVTGFTSDRTLTAKALLQIGLCYEKLVNDEARKIYEQLVRDYADQPEPARQARARLAVLTQPERDLQESTMIARRLWAGSDVDEEGSPSHDGRFLSFVDWETGDLALKDLTTGQKRRLTNKGSWADSQEFAEFSVLSRDGKHVAYAWFNKDGLYDLRVIGVDGSGARVVYANEDIGYLQPRDWSADGKHLLAVLVRKDRTNQMALISVAGGSARILKTFDWRWPNCRFSPDGRLIVYDFPAKEDAPERDIFVLLPDGARETPLTQHPADDYVLGWAPDGGRVLFASNRTGTFDVWSIPVENGVATGPPELVKKDVGIVTPLGFSRKGALYYAVRTSMIDVYLAKVDLGDGKLLGAPKPETQRYVGSNDWAEWSPDGSSLAYLSNRGPRRAGARAVIVRSLETGDERELSPKLNWFNRIRWSPDGRAWVTTGADTKGRQGLYRIDAQSADVTPLVQSAPGHYSGKPEWSPEGQVLFYKLVDWSGDKAHRIMARTLATGEDREIFRVAAPSFIGSWALSLDGRRLAASVFEREGRVWTAKIIPVDGGEPREFVRLRESEMIADDGLAWTPGDRSILYVKRLGASSEGGAELWRFAVEEGIAQKLDLNMKQVRQLRIDPRGERIAFTAGSYEAEVWVMENLLPTLKAAR